MLPQAAEYQISDFAQKELHSSVFSSSERILVFAVQAARGIHSSGVTPWNRTTRDDVRTHYTLCTVDARRQLFENHTE